VCVLQKAFRNKRGVEVGSWFLGRGRGGRNLARVVAGRLGGETVGGGVRPGWGGSKMGVVNLLEGDRPVHLPPLATMAQGKTGVHFNLLTKLEAKESKSGVKCKVLLGMGEHSKKSGMC